jgi:hypothetical protein
VRQQSPLDAPVIAATLETQLGRRIKQMKKILMLLPLLALLVGCNKSEDQTSAPAEKPAATNAAPSTNK